ncbi:SusC/RagA family TonB-linked outer membrane protein [Flavivirga spongiicola]|uniref:SusC/RagA family TonB-linked outer membrane protein n=1 Tax=Flavivirga spongiicola TaxID=421621 RepID=A0ABU7XS11_9FLAO|nr:SusC/RagA family TonB-linked outer membrane protein [Flavivirga sp. MEBiC05379]MDO5978213.1 SusC/RagA family TonB-linked outer membrane protein [Flavivirga sp. MEBiC05379]
MRTFIFLFCTTLFSLTPNHVLSQNEKIVIDSDKEISVDEVFKMVKIQTDYMFVYHRDLFKNFPKVQLKKGKIKLNTLLNQSLSSGDINIIFTKNNTILIKEKIKTQQRQVSGTVTDQSGLPVPGVTVLIKGTNRGVATNLDGQYVITVPDPANILVFSSLGFEPLEVTVGNQTVINLSLKEAISQLDVVTINAGYYNTSERERTGNISKIEAKDIEKQPVNNPLAAMQGHISGVNINQNTGLPGGGYRIRIRGQNFIDIEGGTFGTANDPLYVVDGVPYDSGSLESSGNAIFAITFGGVSPLNAINPADIKSVEVLKDADATAIYGSRGANGVVLITTKKGRIGKTQVKLDISTTLGKSRYVDLLNTDQYLEMRREALINDGLWPVAPDDESKYPDLFLWDQDRNTDWQEVLIGGTAYRQNAQLSFSGGSEHTQFLLSGGHVSETTVFPGDFKYKSTSVRFNVNHRSKNDHFHLNASVNYSTDSNNLPGTDLSEKARTLPPNAPMLYNDDGSLNWENSTWENPLAILESKYNAITRNLIANTVLSYYLTSSLEIKTSLGYTDYRLESYFAQPHTVADPKKGWDSSLSWITPNTGSRQSWIVEPQINWQQDWDDVSFKLLLGATFQQSEDQQLTIRGDDFPSNDLLLDINSADLIRISQNLASEYKYQSFFGRINVNWQNKYILNLTGRRDGSSRFGPGKRFGYFGAIGAAWLFTEEGFLEDNNVLSFGKLRGSYGITGSDSVGNYKFYEIYEVDGNYNGSGLLPKSLFNPDFAWESNKKLEVGLDMGFFKDRIFLTTAWYRNRSSNQLIDAPLPGTTGFSDINTNFDAVVENTGIEIDLRTVNIQNDHFKWSTTFNISANRNKLVAFPGLEGSTFESKLVIGQPLGTQQLYHFLGVDPETGIYQYEDYNNDGFINTEDEQWFEDFTPKYFGGMGNTIKYKNLQFDVFFQYTKQKSFSYLSKLSSPPGTFAVNQPELVLDRWQQSGDENPIQRFASISNNEAFMAWTRYGIGRSNGGVTDASFIRLRNVSLTYTIPKAYTKDMDINIYLQGQNLFTITRYDGADPEVQTSATLSSLRQFTLGFNLSF